MLIGVCLSELAVTWALDLTNEESPTVHARTILRLIAAIQSDDKPGDLSKGSTSTLQTRSAGARTCHRQGSREVRLTFAQGWSSKRYGFTR